MLLSSNILSTWNDLGRNLIALIAQILLFLGCQKIEKFAQWTGITQLLCKKLILSEMLLELKPHQVGRSVNLVVALQLLPWILLEMLPPFRRTNPLVINLDAVATLRPKLPEQDLLGAVVLAASRILSTLFSRSFCSLVDKKGEM